MLELRCYCQEREDATAEEKEANDALSNNVVDECKQAFEGEGVNAIATAKKKRDTVFEAHSVWDLTFEKEDLCVLLRCRIKYGESDKVFSRIEIKTFSEMKSVDARYKRTKTFDERKNLLVKISFDI